MEKLADAEPRIAHLIARNGKPLIPILAFAYADFDFVAGDDPIVLR